MSAHLVKLHLFTTRRDLAILFSNLEKHSIWISFAASRQFANIYLYTWEYTAMRLQHGCPRMCLTSQFYVSRVLINFRWPARMCWPLALLVTRSSALKFFCQKVLRNVCRISEEVTWWFGCTAYYQTHTANLSLDLRNTAQLLQHGSSTANSFWRKYPAHHLLPIYL